MTAASLRNAQHREADCFEFRGERLCLLGCEFRPATAAPLSMLDHPRRKLPVTEYLTHAFNLIAVDPRHPWCSDDCIRVRRKKALNQFGCDANHCHWRNAIEINFQSRITNGLHNFAEIAVEIPL